MKFLLLLFVTVLIAGGGFYYLNQSNTVDYTAEVQDEVTALSAELAEIDAAVSVGTLSADAAIEAQRKIYSRLAGINETVSKADVATLTEAQKQTLSSALTTLFNNLARYKDTIAVVEVAAEAKLAANAGADVVQPGWRGASSLSVAIADTLAVVTDASLETAGVVSESLADAALEAHDQIMVEIGPLDEIIAPVEDSIDTTPVTDDMSEISDEGVGEASDELPGELVDPMPEPAEESAIACTADAMLCPDGTYVGRTGPNCEFVCP